MDTWDEKVIAIRTSALIEIDWAPLVDTCTLAAMGGAHDSEEAWPYFERRLHARRATGARTA
jgi:hypothetical protein